MRWPRHTRPNAAATKLHDVHTQSEEFDTDSFKHDAVARSPAPTIQALDLAVGGADATWKRNLTAAAA